MIPATVTDTDPVVTDPVVTDTDPVVTDSVVTDPIIEDDTPPPVS